jgi:hypothetical protein
LFRRARGDFWLVGLRVNAAHCLHLDSSNIPENEQQVFILINKQQHPTLKIVRKQFRMAAGARNARLVGLLSRLQFKGFDRDGDRREFS